MTLLACVLAVVICSVITVTFTYFFDFCIGEPHAGTVNRGRIFSKLGQFILRKYNQFEDETERLRKIDVQRKVQEQASLEEISRAENWSRVNMWKAAGVCPICFNVWASFVVSTLAIVFFSMPWFCFLIVAFMSTTLARLLYRF